MFRLSQKQRRSSNNPQVPPSVVDQTKNLTQGRQVKALGLSNSQLQLSLDLTMDLQTRTIDHASSQISHLSVGGERLPSVPNDQGRSSFAGEQA